MYFLYIFVIATCYAEKGRRFKSWLQTNKKLSYCRGTTRCTMLVNSCYVSQGIETFQTAKVTLKVIQGHWQWCHSIGHLQFPIRLLLRLCLYLAMLTRYDYWFLKI